jgi:hypothetical protein
MRKKDNILRAVVAVALTAILLPLALLLLFSASMLLIPVIPLVAAAGLVVLVLAARSKRAGAADPHQSGTSPGSILVIGLRTASDIPGMPIPR